MDINLGANEEIVATVRKHWIIPVSQGFFLVAVFFVPALLYAFLSSAIPAESLPVAVSGNATALGAFLYALWGLLLWVIFTVLWLDYYLDSWVITTKQIIDIEQGGLFHRDTATCLLSQVQDITTVTSGVLPTLLGYGDIHVQTAASSKEFVIRSVPNPIALKNIIAAGHEKALMRLHQGDSSKSEN